MLSNCLNGYQGEQKEMPEVSNPDEGISELAAEYKLRPQVLQSVAKSIAEGNDADTKLMITTKEEVTKEKFNALKEAGYEVAGSFGKMVNINAPATNLLSPSKGLQNFNWIRSVDIRSGLIHH